MTGSAQSQERVSEFLRNTNGPSPWFERPELVEIKASGRPGARDAGNAQRLFEFSMRLSLKRPQESLPEVEQGKPAAKRAAKG